MCGRYVTPDEAVLNREYYVDHTNSHIGVEEQLEAIFENYNVAPTVQVPVVRVIRDQAGVRESLPMRWGLIPYFAADQPPRAPRSTPGSRAWRRSPLGADRGSEASAA